jgi:Outer membrane protein beta-barrel family/CarboxypepD_reg-like domain
MQNAFLQLSENFKTGMKFLTGLLSFWLLFAGTATAQGFKLDGVIIDADDHTTMPGAFIKLSYQEDSTRATDAQSDMQGRFLFQGLPPANYVLEIKYIGYKTAMLKVRINGSDKHLGNILLVKTPTTFKDVQIVAKENRVKQKEDTSEYNAQAFKVNPDASAEDLVTKMPGITSNNGTVTAHGETVQQVYIDGKEFFGPDATLALKNLPAEVIDKVQVFDKWSDQAQFTGFDDGNSQKAINIVTKKNRRNGIFGKIYAGYGYLDDSKYSVGGSLNWFNGDRRLSVIGMSNNVNIQNFSTQDLLGAIGTATQRQGRGSGMGGGGRGGGQGGNSAMASNFLIGTQPGISTTSSAGLNYVDLWGKKKKVKIVASYFFNLTKNTDQTSLTRQYFNSGDSSAFYNENDQTNSRNINHRVNIRLECSIDTNNKLIFTPKLNLQQNNQTLNQFGQTTIAQTELISQSQTYYNPSSVGYNLSGDILWQHKFKKPKRTFSADISSSYNTKVSQAMLKSMNYYSENNDSVWLNQTSPTNSNSYTLGANLAYTEPAGKTGMLQFNYTPSNQWSNSNQQTNNYDSLLDSYSLLDTALSSKYNSIYMTQKGGVTYRFGTKHINLSVGVNEQYALLTGTEVFPTSYHTNRTFINTLPNAMFTFKADSGSNLRIFYRTSTNPPSIAQLQDVINNNNPLLLSTGNPYLKQAYTHSILLRYGLTKSKTANSLFAFLTASYTQNYVGSSTFIASKDTLLANNVLLNKGSQITSPVNLNGAINGSAFINYGFPIEKIKCNMNLTAGVSYNRTPGLINYLPNWASTYNINGGFVLGSNISEKIDFTLTYTGSYNIVQNTLQSAGNNNYFNHTASVKFNWMFYEGFVFNTSLQNTLYEGVSQGFNVDVYLWNIALGYKFLKDKSFELRASVNDVLNQNTGISRTVTGTYVEDDKTQVLKRYLMLTATYTLKYYKKG